MLVLHSYKVSPRKHTALSILISVTGLQGRSGISCNLGCVIETVPLSGTQSHPGRWLSLFHIANNNKHLSFCRNPWYLIGGNNLSELQEDAFPSCPENSFMALLVRSSFYKINWWQISAKGWLALATYSQRRDTAVTWVCDYTFPERSRSLALPVWMGFQLPSAEMVEMLLLISVGLPVWAAFKGSVLCKRE